LKKKRNEVIDFTSENKELVLLPEVNIGLVGHVDHGKTTLTQALTGKWTDTHSEEMKRGITIRLGYADAIFYYCKKCKSYTSNLKCPKCFEDCELKRAVSFVDAPGHETLMATVLSGAALMDGALLVISADEKCPQPQTAEHLKALDIVGIKNIVIVQTKIDLVSEDEAIKNYNQIKDFIKGTVAENSPIIPISAIHNCNIDVLIEAIESIIKTPKRDLGKPPKFFVARSFDINKPGTTIEELKGGVIGGALTQGILKIGDEIEIKPGVKIGERWEVLKTKIVEIVQIKKIEELRPGGLVALQTELDPSLTRADGLTGSIVGLVGKTPEIENEIKMKVELFDYVIGIGGHQKVNPIKTGDTLMLTAAIAKTVGIVKSIEKNIHNIKLKIPICIEKNDKIAIAGMVGGRWHLIGVGTIL
jgi:translation initiation factor 2 subunit 3